MADEEYFPPRCCPQAVVPKPIIRRSLFSVEWSKYQAKVQEYATPLGDRIFCPRLRCRKFLPRRFLWNFLSTIRCPHCQQRIANPQSRPTRLKKDPMAGDEHLEETLEMAQQSGWRRCFRCQTMIEKTDGCRRIDCPCGASMCYTCGSRMGSCQCTRKNIEQPWRGRPPIQPTPAPAVSAPENLQRRLDDDQRAHLVAEVASLRCSDEHLQHLHQESESIKSTIAGLRDDLHETGQLSEEIDVVRDKITELNRMRQLGTSPRDLDLQRKRHSV
ncbi:MAG: hypothetical protein M1823_001331 [Watsoniomyces obsoletus]|nr:MAG: hypothetical protein M1823_001331 [Watsoniomyces obsoletus]